jgi:hypothetical protein
MLDVMSQIDSTKKIYLIVHGQRQLMDTVKDKLAPKFSKENMLPASLEKAGETGEYVAMIWPPMAPTEIVVSEITGPNTTGEGGRGMGAWGTVSMKELMRLPLK